MTQTGTSSVNPTLNVIGKSGGGITVNDDDIQLSNVLKYQVLGVAGNTNTTPGSTKINNMMLLNLAESNGTNGKVIAADGSGGFKYVDKTNNVGTVTSVAGNNGLTGTVTSSGNIGMLVKVLLLAELLIVPLPALNLVQKL